MKQIYQTRFGGKNEPLEKQGNCFQACIATVLQMPLEEAFDAFSFPDNQWFKEFNKWLEQYNLGCIFIESTKERPVVSTEFKGLHIAECVSKTLYNGERHVVVLRDGYILHDPIPYAKEQGEFLGIYIFVPLEAYRLVRLR